MKTLYLECNMGVAGDMLMGALLELIPDQESFLEKLEQAGIPDVHITAEKSIKCGITGTHMRVSVKGREEHSLDVDVDVEGQGHGHHHHQKGEHPHGEEHHGEHFHHTHPQEVQVHHQHTSLEDISHMIDRLLVEDKVKEDVKHIYRMIAEAESQVHGHPVSQIHLHEVGAVDALADITGCAMLIRQLGAERIIVSPVTVGFGQVHCAHGILPVPAPATTLLLKGIPCMAGKIRGELCTPTGAALVKYYADAFDRMPEMVIQKIGYGMGTKDFEAANCIRAILGES